jgi:hypothetical protein
LLGVSAFCLTICLATPGCVRNRDDIPGPVPSLEALQPDLVCLEQAQVEVRLIGDGMAPLVEDAAGGEPTLVLPEIGLLRTADLDGSQVAGAREVVLERGLVSWESQRSLRVALTPEMALTPGVYRARVTNGSGKSATLESALVIASPPDLESAEPQLACGAQTAIAIRLLGQGFLRVNEALPSVVVDSASYPALSVGGCAPIPGRPATVQRCTELTFELPAGAHAPGWHGVQVTNPPPADCSAALEDAFHLTPEPVIARVSPITPCDRAPTGLRITGSGFLTLDGQGPAVDVAGVAAVLVATEGCSAIDGLNATLCTGLEVQVPAGTVTPDGYTVQVTNPEPHGCQASRESSIGFPPTVAGVSPADLCAQGGTLTVTGSGFADGAVVTIGGGGPARELETTFVDSGTLLAVVPDPTPPGQYDVIVTNPDGCAGTLAGVFDVNPNPVVYFVDPFSLYNGIQIQVVIYTSGILGQIATVEIFPSHDPVDTTALTFTYDGSQRVQAAVPAGLAPGSWGVRVVDDLGCAGSLSNAFSVVEELSVAIDRVELPFGWTQGWTGVNIYSPAEPAAGLAQFAATPRFYLNPEAAGPGTLASELTRTAFVQPTRCSSVVPAGLPTGVYDLVAVNPDGAVGLLRGAFTVTAEPPPVVLDLAPSSLENQGIRTFTILGENFRAPLFSATCRQPNGTQVSLVGEIDTWGPDAIRVSVNFSAQTVADGSICIVRVTNDDATYADFSALGITNPSLNLEHFDPTGALNLARRAPCAAWGQPLPGARFVYALGGDDGTTKNSIATTYHDAIEMAAVDPYGELTPWRLMPTRLPAPRSFLACASLGRFVYVVGGQGGAGAEATAWRAQVLDPDAAPDVLDVDLVLEPEAPRLFEPGRYVYRISAVMAVNDALNPGGESLAGDPFLIQVPDIPARVSISLAWSEVPGAIAYRVYRTAHPGEPAGMERLLAEVDTAAGRSLVDDGGTPVGTAEPLPLGSLGQFAPLPDLLSPREGLALTVAADPADASLRHLYALGGRDAASVALDSLERLTVRLEADEGQSLVAGWTAGTADIGTPRWQLGAFVADQWSGPDIIPAGDTWIYAGGGLNAATTTLVPDLVALKVEAGGALGESAGTRYAIGTMQPFRAGYAAMLFNNQLFAFGGTNAMPVTEGSSIEMCLTGTGICNGGAPEPPDLMNWNNLGLNMTVARYLVSGVTVSAFIFLIGGIDSNYQPLAATEKTLW